MTEDAPQDRPLILVEPSNPLDVTPEDVQALCDALAEHLPDVDFEVGYEEQHGAGVTWREVLHIFVPDLASLRDNVYAAMIGVVAANMRQRFVRRTHGQRRPRSFIIYGADTGEPIESYVLREVEGELKRDTTRKGPKRAKPRHRRGS
jgi:hypothetical protein